MLITELVYIDDEGYHYEDYPSFLTWLQDEYKAIYGADVYLEADSQDGQWIAVQAKAFYDQAALGASIYNSFSPSTGQGLGLARNVKINGLNKRSATYSTADLFIVGQPGTIITNGVAIDSLDQKWNLPSTVTIPGGGEITVTATAQLIGALSAEADTIDQIFTPTLGWQSVNNVADATEGVAVETDAQLRIRQAQSTANPSLTVLEGTTGAVFNLAGVTKVRGYENDTGSTDSDGLPAHSISIVADGGVILDIAQTIALHKTRGTSTYGTTEQLVYDSKGMPLNIKFYRPDEVTIKVEITVTVTAAWSNAFIPLIQEAVANTINANRIGDDTLITKLYAPAYLVGTAPGQTFDITLLEIGKDADPVAGINIPLAFNENAVCVAADDVTVIVT